MTAAITFYTHPMSRGRIIRWMLEEVGQPYDTEILGYGNSMKDDSYLAVNPMGKVPAIVHDGKVVTECAAICAYLADAFPDTKLAPAPSDRADYYRWIFFAAGPLEAAITNCSLGVQVPEDKRGMVGYGSFEDAVNTLETAVSGKQYIAGNSFTAADLYVGSHIAFGLMFGSLEKRPAFLSYINSLQERPAYKRAAEIDDALIKAAQETA
ncbi:glutathione S-transferase family protein [Tianweitania sp. BSSL-BM11]|uniref:Glutathione S-transferase family protein n=1 Tax=Tianweitania aestuarii TaxID=2814886 RepID=A0ABS5RUH8_9HYPH|nr:glutathione S-transferase family protein [Tianweitania aestuarii]MBS9720703.1 glutathione S-transferase family protein [Tianweitania aestuarii]